MGCFAVCHGEYVFFCYPNLVAMWANRRLRERDKEWRRRENARLACQCWRAGMCKFEYIKWTLVNYRVWCKCKFFSLRVPRIMYFVQHCVIECFSIVDVCGMAVSFFSIAATDWAILFRFWYFCRCWWWYFSLLFMLLPWFYCRIYT